MGNDTVASMFEIGMWQPCGFILKGAKTEARSAGLGDNKASVFEQQFLRLIECAFRAVAPISSR